MKLCFHEIAAKERRHVVVNHTPRSPIATTWVGGQLFIASSYYKI